MSAKPSSDANRESRWIDRLLAALAADGWSTQSEVPLPGQESHHSVDVIARKGQRTYVIEVKGARDARSTTLISLAAAGLLQARKYASVITGTPMVVVGAPRLSPSLVQALRQFLADFGDGASWGAVDESGLLELHGAGLEGVNAAIGGPSLKVPRDATSQALRARMDPLSDLGQWCQKVLLSHLLPAELQLTHGSHVGRPVRNANELARMAGVSAPTAWRMVSALREDGLLSRSEPLELLRPEVLMTRWQATNLRQRPDIRARWLFPSQAGPLERLQDTLRLSGARPDTTAIRTPRMALGLFAAAEVLGHGFVRGVAPHLLHENPSAGELERLGLTPAGPGERVDVFVRKPRFPEAVFRGVAPVNGVPVADIFQVWLDVSAHPARGREMADHLASRVLSRVFSTADEHLITDDEIL
ncbi:MAG: hypothetical protein H0T76_24085 [Nannocystis sp.]|nr:hypothetical protein [Nannocystis sp.]MBA3549568.1 hypothetical protein [Nannocystis sp.]